MITYLTVRLEANSPHLFNHLSDMVFITRQGRRNIYWTETGFFWLNESKQAEVYAKRVLRRGLKASIISKTIT